MSSATHLCGLGSSLWCQISCSRLRFELLLQRCRCLGVLYTKWEKNTKPLWPAWCNSFSQRSFERKGNSPWVQSRLLKTKSHLQIPSSICYFCTGFLRSVWTRVWCIFCQGYLHPACLRCRESHRPRDKQTLYMTVYSYHQKQQTDCWKSRLQSTP